MTMITSNQHNSLWKVEKEKINRTEWGGCIQNAVIFVPKSDSIANQLLIGTNAEVQFSLQKKKSTNFIFCRFEDKLENFI